MINAIRIGKQAHNRSTTVIKLFTGAVSVRACKIAAMMTGHSRAPSIIHYNSVFNRTVSKRFFESDSYAVQCTKTKRNTYNVLNNVVPKML